MTSVQFLDECDFAKGSPAYNLQTFEVLLPQTRPAQSEELRLFLSMDLTMFVSLMVGKEVGLITGLLNSTDETSFAALNNSVYNP